MADAFQVTRDFEKAISEYTGAPYVVAVNSCSNALLISFLWYWEMGGKIVNIPSKTYPSVPMGARHAGLDVAYVHKEWKGGYECYPSNIWDYACRFTSGMYVSGDIQCVSFHAKKLLKIGQGGAILHDNEEADIFFRAMRFDGRTEGVLTNEDTYPLCGYHCYMSPPDASRGLWLIQDYPQYMPDIPTADYPDMSRWSWPR
jgi:dTDP-4-amino-4,6-dideoxygalactose transaminase